MAKATIKRQDNGTFDKGTSGGPGRPARQTEAAYMRAVMTACTPDVWAEIVEKAVTDAKAGDRYARDWLARYLIGEPSPNHYAPKPSKVAAMDELGDDGVDAEKARLKHEKIMIGIGY